MDFNSYEKLSVGVDCVIFTSQSYTSENVREANHRGIQVLLIKRNIEPFKDMWAIPGGLVDVDKGLLETINTKLFNKTNLSDVYKEQLYTYGDDINRDPRGRVISVAYMALANKDKLSEIRNSGHGEVRWFWVSVDNSNKVRITDTETGEDVSDLAFDHYKIISDAFHRMQGKLNYTNIAFQMLPERFTIRELQDVYETIIGKPIYSFRRYVDSKVEETDEYSETKAHRPSKLFKYKEDK